MSLSEEDGHALAFFTQRAMYYRRIGITFCGTCGVEPEPQPVFNPSMPCGHPWSGLMWRLKTKEERERAAQLESAAEEKKR